MADEHLTPISDSITTIAVPDVPKNALGVGAKTDEQGDVTVAGAINKDLGKDWSLTAWGSWAKQKGWAAGAWVSKVWKPKASGGDE